MTETYFKKLILSNFIDNYNQYYKFLINNNINEYIKLLSLVSNQYNISNNKLKITIRNRLIKDIKSYFTWRGPYVNLIPIYKKIGGASPSEMILPVVNDVFILNENELILESENDEDNILINIVDCSDLNLWRGVDVVKRIKPLFSNGTYTSVYKVIKDGQEYILRMTTSDKIHFLYNENISDDYNKYSDNLIKIYLHGIIKFDKKKGLYWISSNPNEKNMEIFNFDFDYILTKKYNRIQDSKLNNEHKYKLLMNLLLLLQKLVNNNDIHTDLKLDNIGWNDNYDIIFIDYDSNTIMSLNYAEELFLDNDKLFYKKFSSSFRPYYITNLDHNDKLTIKKYDKYSIYGLYDCIKNLGIKLKDSTYLMNHDLYSKNRLNNQDYDLIPTYEQLIDDLIRIKDQII
jgi:hypothetical protein